MLTKISPDIMFYLLALLNRYLKLLKIKIKNLIHPKGGIEVDINTEQVDLLYPCIQFQYIQ